MYQFDPSTTGFNTQDFQNQISKMLMPQQSQQSIHVVKVNGRAGAEAFTLPPNSDTILLDMNDPIAWFVMTDGAGYKTVTPYNLSAHKEVNQTDVIKSLEDRITKLEEAIANGKPNFRGKEQGSKSWSPNNDAGGRSNDKG